LFYKLDMRTLLLSLLLIACTIHLQAKENTFFAGIKLNNGRKIDAIKNSFANGTFRDKSYFLSNTYYFGGTIKNVSISCGIAYNLYHYNDKRDYLFLIIGPNYQKKNNHILSIPFNVDYNINIYKEKLFVIVGAGIEYTITLSQVLKPNNGTVFPDVKVKHKALNNTYKTHALLFNFRSGLLYAVNKRVDIFTSFDFGIYANKYMALRNDYPSANKKYTYLLSNSIGVAIKFAKLKSKSKN